MRAGRPRSLVTESLASDRRAMLPFLPTLATALAVAAVSLLCRPPAAPSDPRPSAPAVTVEAVRMGEDGFHAVHAPDPARAPSLGTAGSVPATLAFARLSPPAFATDEAARPPASSLAAGRPAHLAVQAAAPAPAGKSRPCTGSAVSSRCAEARRGETARGPSVASPARPAAESASGANQPFPLKPATLPEARPEPEDGFLPKDALPYASTAAAWVDGMRRLGGRIGSSVGREAASVGGSVVELLASAR